VRATAQRGLGKDPTYLAMAVDNGDACDKERNLGKDRG